MKRTKLQLEHPGQHVAKASFWTPSGASIGYSGAIQQTLFEFCAWAMVHQLAPSELRALEELTERVKARVTEDSR